MKLYRRLRYGRTLLAVAVWAAITIAVATGSSCFLSRLQIVEAIAACSLIWMGLWLMTALIFGRIYCSTVCPAGTVFDIIARLNRLTPGRRRRYHYSYRRPLSKTRYSFLAFIVLCALLGLTAVTAIFDPYSSWSRIVVAVARPAAVSIASFVVAGATAVVWIAFSLRRGRMLCNSVCPVGTMLGLCSKASLFHPDINTDLCTNCGACSDVCKSECIDIFSHTIDPTRCVVCFDCMDVCPNGALTYRRGRHQLSIPMLQPVGEPPAISAADAAGDIIKPLDRRAFLMTGIVMASTLAADATRKAKRRVAHAGLMTPLNPVTPPGTKSRRDFMACCTGCGNCVTACPAGTIVVSGSQYGLRNALHPVMDFSESFCRYDCVKCTEVCPTDALTPLTPAEKHKTAIGKARIDINECILYADGEPCGRCARRCPTQAIRIVTDTSTGSSAPHVSLDDCIGCGACFYVCPATPLKAIVIEGIE